MIVVMLPIVVSVGMLMIVMVVMVIVTSFVVVVMMMLLHSKVASPPQPPMNRRIPQPSSPRERAKRRRLDVKEGEEKPLVSSQRDKKKHFQRHGKRREAFP